jgi:hypothetical protein
MHLQRLDELERFATLVRRWLQEKGDMLDE